MSKSIRVFDYVNHPYESVRKILTSDAQTVFSNATRAAASRAQTVASELRVQIGGIDIGRDIVISIEAIEDKPESVKSLPSTVLHIQWEAASAARLFPMMKADLAIYPLTATETQLELTGNYEAPLGIVGGAIDAIVGNRIAEATVHRFIQDVAAYLRSEL